MPSAALQQVYGLTSLFACRWNQKRTYEGILEDLGGDIVCIQGERIR